MRVLRLLPILCIATLLSSCDQKASQQLSGIENDIKEIKGIIKLLFERVRNEVKENPCVVGTFQSEQCFYVMTITQERNKDNVYQGKTSNRVCVQNKRSGNSLLDCDKFNPAPRWFRVNGNPDLKEGKDYDLYSEKKDPPTDVLTCHDQNNQVTKTCVARTMDLPIVP